MAFQTRLVVGKKNPKVRIAGAGAVLLVVSVFLTMAPGYNSYALWGFGVSVALILVGAVLAKGDLADIEVSDSDLVINVSEIRTGDSVYPLSQVEELVFDVEGYDGMIGKRFTSPEEGQINGMDNTVRFTFIGEKQDFRFYLSGPAEVQQLGLLFKELYEKRIPFEERRRGHRTFMFEAVTDEQLADRKLMNGY